MDPFIRYLKSLNSEERRPNTAALAAMRRGLSQPAGEYAGMYPYVMPKLTEEQQVHLPTYCLIASLYAFHPEQTDKGNMGDHMRNAGREKPNSELVSLATERRFVNLLRVHPDDLQVHLRQAISFLKSKKEPVNWDQLLRDILAWDHPANPVQKAWARGFWKYLKEDDNQNQNESTDEEN